MPLVIGGSVGNLKIVEKLVERGHRVTVATPFYMDKEAIQKQYRIKLASFSPFYIDRYIPYRERKYMLYAFLYFFHLMRLLAKEKFDALLVRNCVLAAPCLLAGKFYRIPVFLSMTDFLSSFSYQNQRVPKVIVNILFGIEKWLANQSARTFVISPRMKSELERYRGANEKIAVTYDGVDVESFDLKKIDAQTIERTRRDLGFQKNIVIYHGAIQLDAVSLFEEIIKTTLNKRELNFVIIGMGEGYSRLQARLNQNRNVRFLGFIQHDDLPRFIAASNVGIIPYKRTFNSDVILTLKILEYLSMGLPVVSVNLASISQIFGRLPCVKISGDSEGFSNCIIECLNAGRCQEAIEFIRKNFSWDAVTEKIAGEIELAVAKRR